MTATLPPDVQQVFARFVTTELTTINRRGQPITWPVTPYYSAGADCIDVTTGLGYPKKALDAEANPLVSLLFSDPTGSGMVDPPMVLVQGTAKVDDHDLEANRQRYERESVEKLPGAAKLQPPDWVKRTMAWYYTRIYIHVRPERVYTWAAGDVSQPPEVFGAHLEEVRSGHSQEPERFHSDPEAGVSQWDRRIREFGSTYRSAVLSLVSPDGFPFAIRVPVSLDPAARWINIDAEPPGVPLAPGLACLTAHVHNDQFTWQQNFQVRGDLQRAGGRWAIIPHKLVGGFELPQSRVAMLRSNAAKIRRFRKVAKREFARRSQVTQ